MGLRQSVGWLEVRFVEERERIAHLAVLADLEMQVRTGAVAGRAHQRDLLAALDLVAFVNVEPIQVAPGCPGEFWASGQPWA